ncbi:uracil-DNA glycosylase family protein [Pollutibacter soli]|uniref:uracil-DNA glycosylase family protein n=1 Tax=Pollutibacter soli TaxID=3034157 RepID=UPI003013914C
MRNLQMDFPLPEGVGIMNPYADDHAFGYAKQFYEKYYHDDHPRTYLIGINPGRLGGGITGIPFTDPQKLENYCGIKNDWEKRTELSADFIYRVITAYGGPAKFYNKFFFTAVSPLGFIREGKNMNYYDDKQLIKSAESFIIDCFHQQLKLIPSATKAFCLGEGSNFKYLSAVNQTHGFFEEIVPLPHPRWVMQYRRKKMEEFVELYCKNLG